MVQKNELDINKNNILTRNKSLSRRVRFSCVVEKNVDLIVNLPLSQKLKLVKKRYILLYVSYSLTLSLTYRPHSLLIGRSKYV